MRWWNQRQNRKKTLQALSLVGLGYGTGQIEGFDLTSLFQIILSVFTP